MYYFLACIVFTLLVPAQAALDPVDMLALQEIRDSFATPPGSWSLADGCSWSGITCMATITAHVTQIALPANNLQGTLSPFIGNLTSLVVIDLSFTQLGGQIPSEIGLLSSLTTLYLNNNALSGTIPVTLGRLENLKQLFLNNNGLAGPIPPSFADLTSMESIQLNNNALSGTIPAFIGSWNRTTRVSLNNNLLGGTIPAELGNLLRLSYLELRNNRLVGTVPVSIGQLPVLQTVLLENNQLSGCFFATAPLTQCNIQNNTMCCFPFNFTDSSVKCSQPWCDDIAESEKQALMDLAGVWNPVPFSWNSSVVYYPCQLWSGVSCNLAHVTSINVSNAQISGKLPESLAILTRLQILDLSGNQLSGLVSSSIGALSNLEILDLSSNKLQGSLTSDLFSELTKVKTINFSYNNLNGAIPSTIASSASLQRLLFSNNGFTGSLPSALAELTQLEVLDFSGNMISGCFNVTLSPNVMCDLSNNGLCCLPSTCLGSDQQVCESAEPVVNPEPFPAYGIALIIVLPIVVGAAIFLVVFLLKRRKNLNKGSSNWLSSPNSNTAYAGIELSPKSEKDIAKQFYTPYEKLTVKGLLGVGSFGQVYEGVWQKSKVALKISLDRVNDEFINEVKLITNMRPHPNIVQTLGYSIHPEKGNLILIMEFCDEGSLDSRLFDDAHAFSLETKLELIKGIALGLNHLHCNNIIHRDIASRNILLSHGKPKISDFGMSREVAGDKSTAKTEGGIGPIRWMAPESIRDKVYSTKSDVWMFGVLMYEIIAEQEPHVGTDHLEIGVAIRDSGVTPTPPPDCPKRILQILKLCWSFNPDDRPSVEQIITMIEKI